jgi:hypothetical protein
MSRTPVPAGPDVDVPEWWEGPFPDAPPPSGDAEEYLPSAADEQDIRDWLAAVEEHWDAEARGVGIDWTALPPGPELGAVLADIDPARLSDYQLVAYVTAIERQRRHLEGVLTAGIATLAGRPVFRTCTDEPGDRGDGEDDAQVGSCRLPVHGKRGHDPLAACADELSPAMTWTTGHAQARVELATALANTYPRTLAALMSGQIDEYKVRLIRDYTRPLSDDNAEAIADVEHAALAVAEHKTGPQLREYIKRRVAAIDPEAAAARRQRASKRRRVTKPVIEPDDGMATMTIHGPVESVAAFHTALDAAARARLDYAARQTDDRGTGNPDAGKTLEQLRFDVLADLAFGALNAGHLGCCQPACATDQRLGTRHGVRAHITVRMSASTAAGLDELPAELEGYGPIPAEVARELAADATWRRLLTDPATGELLDYGRTTYRPPQALRQFLITRDVTCRMPTCTWPAASSDLDHEPAWDDGGRTSPDGMKPLHRRHHVGKTHHGCQLRRDNDGRWHWISATGHTYPIEPEIIDPLIAYQEQATQPAADPDQDEPPPF